MLSPSNPPDRAANDELVVDRVDGDDLEFGAACGAGFGWKVLHNLPLPTEGDGRELTSTTPVDAARPREPSWENMGAVCLEPARSGEGCIPNKAPATNMFEIARTNIAVDNKQVLARNLLARSSRWKC